MQFSRVEGGIDQLTKALVCKLLNANAAIKIKHAHNVSQVHKESKNRT